MLVLKINKLVYKYVWKSISTVHQTTIDLTIWVSLLTISFHTCAHTHTHPHPHLWRVEYVFSLHRPSAILLRMACPTCSSFWYKWAPSMWQNPTSMAYLVASRASLLGTYINHKGSSWISTWLRGAKAQLWSSPTSTVLHALGEFCMWVINSQKVPLSFLVSN